MPSRSDFFSIDIPYSYQDKLTKLAGYYGCTVAAIVRAAIDSQTSFTTTVGLRAGSRNTPASFDSNLRAKLTHRPLPIMGYETLATEVLCANPVYKLTQVALWALFASGRPYLNCIGNTGGIITLFGTRWSFDQALLDAPYRLPLSRVASGVYSALWEARQGKQKRSAEDWCAGLKLHGYTAAAVMMHLSRMEPEVVFPVMTKKKTVEQTRYNFRYPGWETWKQPPPEQPKLTTLERMRLPVAFPESLDPRKVSVPVFSVAGEEKLLDPVVLPDILKDELPPLNIKDHPMSERQLWNQNNQSL